MLKTLGSRGILLFTLLVLLDCFVWYEIVFRGPAKSPELDLLDVGQGDSTLARFPGSIFVLTDAGPDRKVVKSIESRLPVSTRYIDIGIVSHGQLDHFGGFNYLLDHYSFGAFLINGRKDAGAQDQWDAFLEALESKSIPVITVRAGDRVTIGESRIDILSPDEGWIESGELNDTGIVEKIYTPAFSALLTADIGMNIEEDLIGKFDLAADILKVGHHGSKYSSGNKFLEAVKPKIALIGVGAGNTYGHPTKEALDRLGASGAQIFRTDRNGTVRIIGKNGVLQVFVEKSTATPEGE